jgi:endonuclease/exonuclease/phosphatase family metal-dependent hydrolase
MLGRIQTRLRRLRRRFSRSEWLARLLRLPLSAGTANEPGLVLIQIDGLSNGELELALRRGEMPFTQRLLRREHYQLHPMYAGVPSTTPAVQAELFYGVQAAVPGFNFLQRESQRLVRMYEPAAAADVEQQVQAAGGAPLIEGGSCYSDNFTGGAAEPHFCPSSAGWGPALRETHSLVRLVLILSNAYSFVRTAVLLLLELLLALIDFGRGLIQGRDLRAELKFVPTRVLIVILLRELITIGVKIDIARGLPIIHVNFLGYDEHAHRRGPGSLFAHWTLKGIDDAIARIWRASHRSERRSYDVWIYSDHGQQRVQPYEAVSGRSFTQAAAEVFTRVLGGPVTVRSSGRAGEQLQRIRMFGGVRTQAFFARGLARIMNEKYPEPADAPAAQLAVAPLGPVAHLYYDRALPEPRLVELAAALVARAGVPLVLHRSAAGEVRATTQAGEFSLKENPAAVLGAQHPYLEAACSDLVALCEHPDAGILIAIGHCAGGVALSFAIENGAHGGASSDETAAFALLPADIGLDAGTGISPPLARPLHLRRAALRFLNRPADEIPAGATHERYCVRQRGDNSLRIMTYNVHSCIGMDGKVSPERIARVIARYAPDIVALQELDVGRSKTHNIDQAEAIASCLQMKFHFHAALQLEEERYGNAILTHLPMRLRRAAGLPGLAEKPGLEPRGALWVGIDAGGIELQLINTHLGLYKKERQAQVSSLLGEDWLGHPDIRSHTILCGDFNATPRSREWSSLHRRLPDAQVRLADHRPRNTFFSRLPSARIDHVFTDHHFELLAIDTPNTEMIRLASDHLPLIVDLNPCPA